MAKIDMDRIGVFQEMGYTTIGDSYKTSAVSFNEQATKGKQMLPGGSKTRSALQAGYFSAGYNRILEGESYNDPIKQRRQDRLKEAQKNLSKPFLPSSGDKKPSGLGNHFGTLSGPIGAFSPQDKPRKAYVAPGKNVSTMPGKHGTGFGYVNVTIGQYQKHQTDEYDRSKEIIKKEIQAHRDNTKGGAFRLNMHPTSFFDSNPYRLDKPLPPLKNKIDGGKGPDVKPFKPSSPGKVPAGAKMGTFDPYPSHSNDPYAVKSAKGATNNVINKSGKIFVPSAGPKSAPVRSIVDTNVERSVNVTNYKTAKSIMAF